VKNEKLEEVKLRADESNPEPLFLTQDVKIKQQNRSHISKTYVKR
jgi:hypothetical protein